jgi:hypothetical protein
MFLQAWTASSCPTIMAATTRGHMCSSRNAASTVRRTASTRCSHRRMCASGRRVVREGMLSTVTSSWASHPRVRSRGAPSPRASSRAPHARTSRSSTSCVAGSRSLDLWVALLLSAACWLVRCSPSGQWIETSHRSSSCTLPSCCSPSTRRGTHESRAAPTLYVRARCPYDSRRRPRPRARCICGRARSSRSSPSASRSLCPRSSPPRC